MFGNAMFIFSIGSAGMVRTPFWIPFLKEKFRDKRCD